MPLAISYQVDIVDVDNEKRVIIVCVSLGRVLNNIAG